MPINTPAFFYALPFLAGLAFTGIGWAYLAAVKRDIPIPIINLYMGLTGTLYFAIRSLELDWSAVPDTVWFWGAAAGTTQFVIVWGIHFAMQRGPLSPVWCAINLSFVPAIVYAALFLGEGLTLASVSAVVAGITAVVVGSIRQESTQPGHDGANRPAPSLRPSRQTPAATLLYGGILLALLLLNGVMNMGLKVLGASADPDGVAHIHRHGALFFLLLYTGILVPLGAFYGVRSPRRIVARRAWVIGLGAGICSTSGLFMLGTAASLPAVYTFTIACVTTLILTGALSVLRYRERPDRWWVAMMACSVLSVLLAGLGAQ